MSDAIRTLNTIQEDRELLLKTRKMLEGKRAKLDDEIGEVNTKLTHLDIQEQRLLNIKGGQS